MAVRTPLIVLAGNDPQPAQLPTGNEGLRPIVGTKAVDLRIGGRPLISWVVERAAAAGAFGPIYIAGHRPAFEGVELGPAEVIDTNGSFGENIEASIGEVSARHPESPVAFLTCDVLPEPEELAALMGDYRAHAPIDFWFPIVRAPETNAALGASAWKPKYRIAETSGGEPQSLLPAHLLIVTPHVVRLPLVFSSFQVAYQTRNQPILPRLGKIVFSILVRLVLQDLRLIVRGVVPTLTLSVIGQGVRLGFRLRRGKMSTEEVAERFSKIFVRRAHRKRHPERLGRVLLVDTLSLAKDIDTFEEAREASRRFGGADA